MWRGERSIWCRGSLSSQVIQKNAPTFLAYISVCLESVWKPRSLNQTSISCVFFLPFPSLPFLPHAYVGLGECSAYSLGGFQAQCLNSQPYVCPRSSRMQALPGGTHEEVGRGTGRAPLLTALAGRANVCLAALHRPPHPPRRSRGLNSPPRGRTCSGRAWCLPTTCS